MCVRVKAKAPVVAGLCCGARCLCNCLRCRGHPPASCAHSPVHSGPPPAAYASSSMAMLPKPPRVVPRTRSHDLRSVDPTLGSSTTYGEQGPTFNAWLDGRGARCCTRTASTKCLPGIRGCNGTGRSSTACTTGSSVPCGMHRFAVAQLLHTTPALPHQCQEAGHVYVVESWGPASVFIVQARAAAAAAAQSSLFQHVLSGRPPHSARSPAL